MDLNQLLALMYSLECISRKEPLCRVFLENMELNDSDNEIMQGRRYCDT